MAGSTMYAVKAALLTKLQADSTLSSIQVTYGDPLDAMRRESIFMGDINSGIVSPESFSTGRRRNIEEYTIDVEIYVSRNQQDSKKRNSEHSCLQMQWKESLPLTPISVVQCQDFSLFNAAECLCPQRKQGSTEPESD